jgi:Domain of unknown function (DUF6438)/Ankyrin repeat
MLRLSHSTAALALAVLAASVPASHSAPQTIPDDFFITLARTSCFGPCPIYSVSIDAKGTVRYEGKKNVRVTGRQSDQIPVSRVAELAATVDRIRFFELDDRYRFIRNADGTTTSVTDLPTTFVTVMRGGQTKSIEDYVGAPEPLKQLEKQIDEAARTKRWVTIDEPMLRHMVRDGWTPSAEERAELLRTALQDDDVGVIKVLLQNGADPNGMFEGNSATPLMRVQSAAAARALLAAGANPLTRNRNGGTALDDAVNYEAGLTEVLLTAGIPPDQPDEYGRTPLLQAACVGNAQVVKLLLDRGADPNRRPSGQSALECARSMKDYARLYPGLNSHPPFVADFDRVIALLEQALAKHQRK